MPANRLVMEVCLTTGYRVSDVLGLKTEQLERSSHNGGRVTVRERKTGKLRRCRVPADLIYRCMSQAGRVYVFEGRFDRLRHRTRQAVYKDLRRAAKLFRLDVHVSPHSARKAWAVDEYHRTGSITRVQRNLNHTDPSVTMIYALADQLEARKRHG